MQSPTQRSLKYLREQGYTVAIAEHWNHFARIRQDLFGFIDLCAIKPDQPGVLAIQCTTRSNQSARIRKISLLESAAIWMKAGNRIMVFGWAKRAPSRIWECTVTELTLESFQLQS